MASPYQAYRREQEALRARVHIEPLRRVPEVITAVDVHAGRGQHGVAAAVSCDSSGAILERVTAGAELSIPYVPGFLSFREMPVCLAAIEKLEHRPELLLIDGQGIAHPRRFGIACHVGLTLDLPAIGVAKSLLIGEAEQLGSQRGATACVMHDAEVVGMAVRTRTGVRPVYVSVGHLITLDEAVGWVLSLATRYRLPDPSRIAHSLAKERAREHRLQ